MPAHHPERDPDRDPRAVAERPGDAGPARALVVVLDVANVVGSRPDGWWRDRAGAARRLVAASAAVVGRVVPDPDGGGPWRVEEVVAVVEGRAREVAGPDEGEAATAGDGAATRPAAGGAAPGGTRVVAAPADGDTAVVAVATRLLDDGREVRVVTADRGLRARLPAAVRASGPGWWNHLIGR